MKFFPEKLYKEGRCYIYTCKKKCPFSLYKYRCIEINEWGTLSSCSYFREIKR